MKVTYDRGYAIQTKSLLLENTTTADEAIEQLFEALGLPGNPKDYALEERNIMTGGELRQSIIHWQKLQFIDIKKKKFFFLL